MVFLFFSQFFKTLVPPTEYVFFTHFFSDRLQFTHSYVMWPKWYTSGQRNRCSLQGNKKTWKICIFRWDHNKLHYNLWICAFKIEADDAEAVFYVCFAPPTVCSELTFQNMLLSHNGRVESNTKQIHEMTREHTPFAVIFLGLALCVHRQRLGNSRWCGMWWSICGCGTLAFLIDYYMNFLFFNVPRNAHRLSSEWWIRVSFQSNPNSEFGKQTPREYISFWKM